MSYKVERKIVRSGGSHLITLPKLWVETNKLKIGSPLLMFLQEDGRLIVEAKK
jgi:antitoxin component of MazEF toxin-antitoxin module